MRNIGRDSMKDIEIVPMPRLVIRSRDPLQLEKFYEAFDPMKRRYVTVVTVELTREPWFLREFHYYGVLKCE